MYTQKLHDSFNVNLQEKRLFLCQTKNYRLIKSQLLCKPQTAFLHFSCCIFQCRVEQSWCGREYCRCVWGKLKCKTVPCKRQPLNCQQISVNLHTTLHSTIIHYTQQCTALYCFSQHYSAKHCTSKEYTTQHLSAQNCTTQN